MTSNITEDNTNWTMFRLAPVNTSKLSVFITLLLLATVENVIVCVLISKKKNNDAVSVALIGLAVCGILFSLEGSLNVFTYMYMQLKSGDTFPFMLCSVNYNCWLLAILLSTEQMFVISVIRAVTITKMNKPVIDSVLTKKKAIVLIIIMWVVSAAGCAITITVDYTNASIYPPFCRFRSIVGVFRITLIYFVIMYIFNYVSSVLIYVVSIVVLLKLHLRRTRVDTTDSKKSIADENLSKKTTVIGDTEINEIIIDNSKPYPSTNVNVEVQIRLKPQVEPNSTRTIPVQANTSNNSQQSSRLFYRQMQGRRSSELTATFILGLLIVMHSTLLVPLVVEMGLMLDDSESVDRHFQAMLLAVVNFIVNPFIYMMSLQDIRKKALRYIKCRTTD